MKVLQFIIKPRAKNFNPQINISHMEKKKNRFTRFCRRKHNPLLPTLFPLHCLSRSRKCLTYTFYPVVLFLIICLVQRNRVDLFCRRCTFVVMKCHDDVTRCIFKKNSYILIILLS